MGSPLAFIKLKDHIIQLQAIEGIVPIDEDKKYYIKINVCANSGYYLIGYETEEKRDSIFEHLWIVFTRHGITITVE